MMEVAPAAPTIAPRATGRAPRRATSLAAVLCLLLLGPLPLSAAADPVPEGAPARLGEFEGLWIRVESEEEEQARVSSIERTLMTIPRLLRTLASRVMRGRIRPADRYEFAVEDGELWLATNGHRRHPLPLDGQPRESRDGDGGAVTVTSQLAADGALETSWRREDSQGSEVYRLAEGGSALVVEQTIASSHFEVPVAFRSTFRRSAAVSAGP